MSEIVQRHGGALIGAVLGVIASVLGRFTAQAAVQVRPRLATVGFVDAMLTNHGHDWLFYHHPNAMTAFTVVFVTVMGWIAWRMF